MPKEIILTHEFILDAIRKDEKDPKKELMRTAERYYEGDNDIINRTRYYIDSNGAQVEISSLSNTKISHAFFPKIVDQKVNYLLSKEMSVSTDDDKYSDHLSDIFDSEFMQLLRNVGTDSIISGCAWIQVFYDSEGNLQFQRIPSTEIIPFWTDGNHTSVKAVIRKYKKESDDIIIVEAYDDQTFSRYKLDGGNLIEIDSGGHLKIQSDGDVIDADFGKVPFIPFKYNTREIPLIKYVKALIDAYDEVQCDVGNNIKDTPNNFRVVTGYDGTKPDEFIRNLNTLRTAFVSEGGAINTIQNNIDTASAEAHLSRLRADIYDLGCGVDSQQAAMGNTSGVAIRLRYADLDMSCTGIANEYQASLKNILHFINMDAEFKKVGNFKESKVEFIFNTDIVVNESETIANCQASVGIISEETNVANHPWVTDPKIEIERLDMDRSGIPDTGV
jgi:SPP1 family phage portal protein